MKNIDLILQPKGKLLAPKRRGLVANKGITAVVYNHLDLPEKVSLAGGREIVYLYDAAGTKLAKVVRQAGTGDHRTDYVGEFVYQDGVLEFEEGDVTPLEQEIIQRIDSEKE